ncbi:MAG: hypothetical protein JKY61_05030 [Planctomycetes bacterium]|nr:hypothetical protein [Planctomycetota bacterium]
MKRLSLKSAGPVCRALPKWLHSVHSNDLVAFFLASIAIVAAKVGLLTGVPL